MTAQVEVKLTKSSSSNITLPPANAKVVKWETRPEKKKDWRQVAQRKRDDREGRLLPEARLPSSSLLTNVSQLAFTSGCLTAIEQQIISTPPEDLVDQLASGRLTCYQTTLAFCKAATIAQQATNCLTEILFDEALDEASRRDNLNLRTGPLYGLPVSIKDHIDVKGTDGSSGFVSWCFQRVAEKDACVVDCLRRAGAIIYCKTSNPQSLLAIETDNNIYGRTCNPFNRNLNAGGSSGGEGALLAMRGSCLGVGTDIAGSIRLPALWNGIYGLRPSVGRLPHGGLQGPHEGMDALMGVVGPLSTSRKGLELFCRAVLASQPWHLEAQVINKPWVGEQSTRTEPLTIAVMYDDGLCTPHPPITRALKHTVARLAQAGHRIVEWSPLRTAESDELLFELLLQDTGDEYRQHLAASGEPATPLIEWLLARRAPKQSLTSPNDLWELVRHRERLRQDNLEQWNALQIDAILCPGAPTLGPRHGRSRHWNYTAMWNMLDWPAVTFPVKGISPWPVDGDVTWPPLQAPRSDIERQVWQEWDPTTDSKRYEGAPVGLQLVGRRLEEEALLEYLAEIEKSLSGDKKVILLDSDLQ